MPTNDAKRVRLKWLALCIFGCGLVIMLAVSAILFHSVSFGDRLTHSAGQVVTENQRLAVSLAVGLGVEIVFMVLAYLLFPKNRQET